ncbi:hypothetical protein [Phaeospirillum tilakii]|uniref:Uncharacterized protein n=1 Tax=Phaeospirillum tilakii TaxID=741673 RepID=A0ABW5CHQ1_9PROT
MKLSDFSFHEADVVDLRQDGNRVILVLDGVKSAKNDYYMHLNFCDVMRLHIDSFPMQKIGMFYESGEVLRLSQRREGEFEFFMEWTDFAKHTQTTKYYEIKCSSLQMDFHQKTT